MSVAADTASDLARVHLDGPRGAGLDHFIDGRGHAPVDADTFEITSPIDGSVLTTAVEGTDADVDLAAQAAQTAFEEWRWMPGARRKQLLHAIADLIEERADEIASIETLDTGQPIRFMSKAAARGADNFRFFADRAPSARDGASLPTETHDNLTARHPIGPVGVITPWNTPFMLSTWKIAPALAAGCTVVHKPAEWSPLTARLLADIAHEAGVPPGVLNVVNGRGERTGRAVTTHPSIRAIAFVGGSETGQAIMAQGAPTLKRLHLELGGKNPVIVFDDADFERALDATVFMIFSLNGERCTSGSRLLVQRSIHDAFLEGLSARLEQLRVGDPFDPLTEIGPLIHPEHLRKVSGYLDLAADEGATVLRGEQPAINGGTYVAPAIVCGARNDMRIAQEEVFGPVLTVIPFDDEDEALRLANDVRYGLAAYLWTSDVGRSHRFSRRLDAGMVWVNSENNRHLPTPFGGMKASGIGRDGGDYSFDFYMETKNVCIALDEHRVPRLGTDPDSDTG